MKRRNLIVWAIAAMLLPGCAALPGGGPAPLDTYDLTSAGVQADGPRRSRTQILIAEPTALKVLDGENVVIRPSAGTVEFLKGAQWADRLPRIVQSRLAETMQASGRYGGVGKPGEGGWRSTIRSSPKSAPSKFASMDRRVPTFACM
ncbi:ABC-type transport auxiliary lipoprotein family protein [Neoaquamicrobium sediminum]|uniref:ABC-type transport auxiliary lipoprotein family protein n=1 Tax=Neoaquamicrobium sediminum TaxID=1849104 RepID=UPI0028B03A5C|nr:ABC-type transport auxiliary lipoprotein family protein [Mesorhizobium sediminum]